MLPLDSQLVTTAKDAPVLVVVTGAADDAKVEQLTANGCEVFCSDDGIGPVPGAPPDRGIHFDTTAVLEIARWLE